LVYTDTVDPYIKRSDALEEIGENCKDISANFKNRPIADEVLIPLLTVPGIREGKKVRRMVQTGG
jgi:hypothetical protein